MKAYKHTSGAHQNDTCGLICCATQVILLFWLNFRENHTVVWWLKGKSILYHTCNSGQLNLCLQYKQLKYKSQANKAREETENEAQAMETAEKEHIKHFLFAVVHCLRFCTLPAGKNEKREKANISIIKQCLTHRFSVSLWQWWSTIVKQTLLLC